MNPLTILPPPFWAKYDNDWDPLTGGIPDRHPVVAHCIDVGAVYEVMWDTVLTPHLRDLLSSAIGCDEAEAKRHWAFYASTHDVGKISPNFQAKCRSIAFALGAHGMTFPFLPEDRPTLPYHGQVTSVTIYDWMCNRGLRGMSSFATSMVIGGHHGFVLVSSEFEATEKKTTQISGEWARARMTTIDTLCDVFIGGNTPLLPDPKDHVAYVLLGGMTSTCDWIASDEDFFPYDTMADLDPIGYREVSLTRAHIALAAKGWLSWRTIDEELSFEKLFEGKRFSHLKPVQQAAVRLGKRMTKRCLVIIQSSTGSGKSEAAFYLSHLMLRRLGCRGVYLSMPTQATATGIFPRFSELVHETFEGAQLHLVHGQARFAESYRELMGHLHNSDEDGITSGEFFRRKGCGLLGTAAAGTADQALLGVVESKFFFVKLFGMADKVIIHDEIHSYDLYTSRLMENNLRWCRGLGSPVVMLSATLTMEKCREMFEAYVGHPVDMPDDVPYPSIMCITEDGEMFHECFEADPEERKEIQVSITSNDLEEVIEEVLFLISGEDGGNVIWYVNTVDEAKWLHAMLREIAPADVRLDLIHSRIPMRIRTRREEDVTRMFGRDSECRPLRAITVSTQVGEMSLDLDYDLVVSQVAPICSMLQRMGRGHRHQRTRPTSLRSPRLLLIPPIIDADGRPDFGNHERFYKRYALLKTWRLLSQTPTISIPGDTEAILRRVYVERDDTDRDAIDSLRKIEASSEEMAISADDISVITPEDPTPFYRALDGRRTTDDESFGASTRYGPASAGVVLLRDVDGQPCVENASGDLIPVDLDERRMDPLDDRLADALFGMSLTISLPGASEIILGMPRAAAWAMTDGLSHMVPIVLRDGGCDCGPFVIRLDEDHNVSIDWKRR